MPFTGTDRAFAEIVKGMIEDMNPDTLKLPLNPDLDEAAFPETTQVIREFLNGQPNSTTG